MSIEQLSFEGQCQREQSQACLNSAESSLSSMFYQLLQVAIGTRQSLSRTPYAKEWALLFEMSKKQALVGITFAGVNRLRCGGDFGSSLGIPEVQCLKWLGLTAKIQKRNQELNAECAKVCREFAHDGVLCVVLKGQSNLVYYPEELREARTAGDIDLWCSVPEGVEVAHEVNNAVEKREYRGIEGVIEYCKQYERCQEREIPWDRVLYYHCELTSPSGTGIEPHYRPTYLCSPLRNWRLQRWFRANEQWGVCDAKTTQWCSFDSAQDRRSPLCKKSVGVVRPCSPTDVESIPIPTVSFNAIYQLLHIYKHMFDEGIGLRQLLDYYFVLRALHIEQETLSGSPLKGERNDRTQSIGQWAEGVGISIKSNAELMHTISRLGMRKFASAVMWVLKEVLDPSQPSLKGQEPISWQERWPWMLCEPDEEEGRFLLNEIMLAGNFGKYDTRIKRPSKSPLKGDLFSPQILHAIEKTKHNLRLLTHYPEEVLWEPVFRVYHYIWRKLRLWRF